MATIIGMADTVNTDVFNRINIQRGVQGISKLAPEWYPEEVPLMSPNDDKIEREFVPVKLKRY